jgi:Protein of unknown function (DUF2283)
VSRLATIAPEFVTEVEVALVGEGRAALSEQLQFVEIDHLTYYERDDTGYIHFVRPPSSPHFAKLASPVAETVAFHAERGSNVDVDRDGNLFGVELLDRGKLMAKLTAGNAA